MNYYLKVLKNYAVFTGRASRAEYWMFILINFIVSFLLGVVDGAVGTFDEVSGQGYISGLYGLVVIIPSIAVGVRRMHDVGKSGWYLLIPLYNLILAVTDGNGGDNEYGSNPNEEVA